MKTEMTIGELLTRETEERENMVYQLISSDAICLKEDGREQAFSVLVARTDGETVSESTLAYDVTRERSTGLKLMQELWKRGATPEDVKESVAVLL